MASVQGREKNSGLALSASLHTDSLAVRGLDYLTLSLSLSLCVRHEKQSLLFPTRKPSRLMIPQCGLTYGGKKPSDLYTLHL